MQKDKLVDLVSPSLSIGKLMKSDRLFSLGQTKSTACFLDNTEFDQGAKGGGGGGVEKRNIIKKENPTSNIILMSIKLLN